MIRKLINRAEVIGRYLSWKRAFIARVLICWAFGCVVLLSGDFSSFDMRFQVRGNQDASSDIVIVKLEPNEIRGLLRLRTSPLFSIHEIADVTDSFYWDQLLWKRMLKIILEQNPRKVGVALYFPESLGPLGLRPEDRAIFTDSRVYWATAPLVGGRASQALFANYNWSNVGSNELHRDEDGVIRRYQRNDAYTPHLIERLAGTYFPDNGSRTVNFRGPSGSVFKQFSATEVLSNLIDGEAFKDKFVIIGADSTTSSEFLTPLGNSYRAEVLATMLDNTLTDRWIKRAPLSLYILGILLAVLTAVFAITQYPQSISAIILIWFATLLAALSVWVFDTAYVWIPITAPFITLTATWVVFISFQTSNIERDNWRLHQQQKYLQEVEQLKNNFVSLISHDLKTPIAKIQAIVDRLLMNNELAIRDDLKTLRISSDELNRYIQSILKVLRVESSDFQIHIEAGDINELIEQAVGQLGPLAKEKDLVIQKDLEPMFSIEFDPILIREVIINLLENAIKYTPSGGRIRISSKETDQFVKVEISDTGEGIAEDEIKHVWQKFVRGKDQDLRSKGTGLGLYLVKYFIELHGGRVWLESIKGKGTKVSFSLPLVSVVKEERYDIAT